MTAPASWTILVLAIGATFIWRALGVGIAQRIDPNGQLFQWFSCVAYAMLAGLITRILAFPVGTLEHTETFDRLAAMIIGFAVFFATKRNVFAGTVVAFLVFMMFSYARHSNLI